MIRCYENCNSGAIILDDQILKWLWVFSLCKDCILRYPSPSVQRPDIYIKMRSDRTIAYWPGGGSLYTLDKPANHFLKKKKKPPVTHLRGTCKAQQWYGSDRPDFYTKFPWKALQEVVVKPPSGCCTKRLLDKGEVRGTQHRLHIMSN